MTLENSGQGRFQHARARHRERNGNRSRRGNRDLNRNRRRSPVAYLVVGSLTAMWGFGLLLDNLGLDDVRHYQHRAWPVVLVVVGITLLIHRDASRNRYGFWGTVFLLAGTWLYASQQDWIHMSVWAVLGPALLVFLGASFVYRALRGSRVEGGTHFNASSSPPTLG